MEKTGCRGRKEILDLKFSASEFDRHSRSLSGGGGEQIVKILNDGIVFIVCHGRAPDGQYVRNFNAVGPGPDPDLSSKPRSRGGAREAVCSKCGGFHPSFARFVAAPAVC